LAWQRKREKKIFGGQGSFEILVLKPSADGGLGFAGSPLVLVGLAEEAAATLVLGSTSFVVRHGSLLPALPARK
jgi:hypothetical protein